jgi:hypothetical protein
MAVPGNFYAPFQAYEDHLTFLLLLLLPSSPILYILRDTFAN